MVAATSASRLYILAPAKLTPAFANSLVTIVTKWQPACLLLSADAGRAEPELVARLRETTAAHGVALLVENDPERAEAIGADGVHIPPDAARLRHVRERLGERAIVGVGCIESRHDAMVMAELGADYVAFGTSAGTAQAELIAWWSEIFTVPCVAFEAETPEAAAQLAGFGADFVAVSASLWQAEDALARLGEIASALEQGRGAA